VLGWVRSSRLLLQATALSAFFAGSAGAFEIQGLFQFGPRHIGVTYSDSVNATQAVEIARYAVAPQGGAPAVNELLAGRLSMYFATMSTAGPHIAAGKLLPLATTGAQRAPFLPDLPTVSEAGLKGFTATNWYAFVAPGKTPAPILERWNEELVKALRAPEVADELTRAGLLPAPGTRDELAHTISQESERWGKVIAERKITAE